MEALIANGHPARDVWMYTPRQMSAYLELTSRRRLGQAASDLNIGLSAARGKPEEVKKTIKAWASEAE